MPDKILYFPHIRVPNNEWFTRVLLYWDEVGSIIPDEFLRRPEELGTHMSDLLSGGLVRPVVPRDHIWEVPRFSEAFIDFVDSNAVIASRREVSLESQPTFRVHMEKLGSIADGLIDRGLARPARYPWFEVEEFTAREFMAYLAGVLGRLEELGFEPTTDEVDHLATFSGELPTQAAWMALKERVRADVLENILPAPVGGTSVNELSKFKSRHAGLLRQFRRRIEQAVVDVGAIGDSNLRAEKLDAARGQLTDEIEEISALMSEARWPRIVFGTLCSLATATFSVGAAVATQQEVLAAGALPGLINAVYTAFSGSDRQSRISQSPLAYAALAQRQFA